MSHSQKHCIRWKMHLENKHRKESESLQQTQINQLEAECAAIKHNKASGEEEVINFLDVATKLVSNTLDFQLGELQTSLTV